MLRDYQVFVIPDHYDPNSPITQSPLSPDDICHTSVAPSSSEEFIAIRCDQPVIGSALVIKLQAPADRCLVLCEVEVYRMYKEDYQIKHIYTFIIHL